MIVERLTSPEGFEGVRSAYEDLCEHDPYRSVFVCWRWLRAYMESVRPRWTLLTVSDGTRCIGFCFLVERGISLGPAHLYRELALGAYPVADYASLVIAGGEERSVLRALADSIQQLRWDVFRAGNVKDPRVDALVKRLARLNEATREYRNPSRVVLLPRTWAEYAARANDGDKSARHILRRRRSWPGASFVEADDASIDGDIEALLRLRHLRWRGSLRSARKTYGRLFREAYSRGCCRVGVLRAQDGKPLAAQAAFVDCTAETWMTYTIAYDTGLGSRLLRRRPGIVMMTAGMEHAIAQGFRRLDLGRGDEPYKSDLGSELQMLENFVVRRRNARGRIGEAIWDAAHRVKASARRIIFGRRR
jgi:CelD/BcsL family acetyltransferase involved in cellulose biosynthesis